MCRRGRPSSGGLIWRLQYWPLVAGAASWPAPAGWLMARHSSKLPSSVRVPSSRPTGRRPEESSIWPAQRRCSARAARSSSSESLHWLEMRPLSRLSSNRSPIVCLSSPARAPIDSPMDRSIWRHLSRTPVRLFACTWRADELLAAATCGLTLVCASTCGLRVRFIDSGGGATSGPGLGLSVAGAGRTRPVVGAEAQTSRTSRASGPPASLASSILRLVSFRAKLRLT